MKKTLLALVIVLGFTIPVIAQEGPSPHQIDVELIYWAAALSGADIPIGCTADANGEPDEVVILETGVDAPFIFRGTYRYKRELGVGCQYYSVSGSGDVSEDSDAWIWWLVIAPSRVMNANSSLGIRALDIYHVQNIARTHQSNYNLIGGFRWANTSMEITVENEDRDRFPSREIGSVVKGKLFGPHIGIIGSRRFLVDPLSLSCGLTVSLLKDTTIASHESTAYDFVGRIIDDGTWDAVEWVTTAPVQVIEGEVVLRFASPRMAGMGISLGYLASEWENVGISTIASYPIAQLPGITLERRDLGLSGWRAGLSFAF
jgi:hypothetical protein